MKPVFMLKREKKIEEKKHGLSREKAWCGEASQSSKGEND